MIARTDRASAPWAGCGSPRRCAPFQAWSEHSAAPIESEIVIKPGANTAAFDVTGDAEAGPGEDKFGMTRQPIAATPRR